MRKHGCANKEGTACLDVDRPDFHCPYTDDEIDRDSCAYCTPLLLPATSEEDEADVNNSGQSP